MLESPVFCPSIYFNVMNQVDSVRQAAPRELRATPIIGHQVIVVTKILVNLLANPCQRTNQVIQSFCIGVNE